MFRIFLMPFAMCYGLAIVIRNLLFNWRILPSKMFNVPTIVVGNLSVGGTGKTPHVEYLIRLLKKNKKQIATLSRGYGRKTKGFILANSKSTFRDIGDEPLQYAHKFPNILVSVDSNRCRGVQKLMDLKKSQKPEVVLLDDAFQHRYIEPGLSVLLTDYHKVYKQDYLLPVGTLRENRAGAKRADFIIVTKTPKVLSPITKRRLMELLALRKDQKLFFSYIDYGSFVPMNKVAEKALQDTYNTIVLFTGIANPYPLHEHLIQFCTDLTPINFADHHAYTQKDLKKIRDIFVNVFSKRKIILTTEKDSKRLIDSELYDTIKDLPICYIPIEVKFHKGDQGDFDKQILNYVKKDSGNC
ncbi:MAG: tetraacyldisaccharide 4'-kinase [Bacteroidales bacterium]